MDHLISECERKFHHFFSAENEPKLNLSQYISQEDEESFSLNSLTEMDLHLLKDKHFNEMHEDVKRYCDPAYVKKARHLDRYYVLLAGLLRQLLRSSGSTFDPYERKELIEKVYSWYRDKRKLLLDYRLKLRRQKQNVEPPQQSSLSDTLRVKKLVQHDEEDAIKLEDLDQRENSSLPKIKSPSPKKFDSVKEGKRIENNMDMLPPQPQLPQFVNQEKKKELFISNKLKQYSRRNLASSHSSRMQRKKPGTAQPKAQQQQQQRDQSTIPDQNRPSTTNTTSSEGLATQPKLMTYKKDFEFSEMGVYNHWLHHRAREAQEDLEEADFQDTITTWASNRARIEEEIHRRQEASRYSSQTGVTVHKILRKPDHQQESEQHRKRIEELRRNADTFLDSDSDFSDDDRDQPNRGPLDSPEDEEETSDADDVQPSTSEEEDEFYESNEPVFLSPYNNMHSVTHQFRPPSPLNPDTDIMNEEERKAANSGFVRPMTTGASTLPRNPIINYHREVEKPQPAEDGAEPSKQPLRPKTVNILDRNRKSSSTHVHYTNPEKEHFHSVLDREGLVEEPKSKKKGKGKKKGAKKGAKKAGGKKTKGKKGADKKAAPAEDEKSKEPVPPPPRPPSLLRSAQLDECERVKLSLSKSGWNVPSSVIQQSILIPEDLSHQECRSNLPSSAFLRLECVMADEEKDKKKKKGKKSGKKKKKKGKKKKKK